MSNAPTAALAFTNAQQAAIDDRDGTLLVNAGAGAGKTRVLTERVLRLIEDPRQPVDIERLLIVTFTQAAAHEMRQRIDARLRHAIDAAEADGDQTRRRLLASQLMRLPMAPISTFHAYFAALLRERGLPLGVAPDFAIASEEEARLDRAAALAADIDAVLAEDADAARALRAVLATRGPLDGFDAIEAMALRLQAFLDALARPDNFVAEIDDELAQLADPATPIEATRLHRRVVEHVGGLLDEARSLLRAFFERHASMTLVSHAKYLDAIRMAIGALDAARANPVQGDALMDFAGVIALERNAKIKSSTPDDLIVMEAGKVLKAAIDDVKDRLKPLSGLSLTALRADAAAAAPFLRLMWRRLGLEFNERLRAARIAEGRLTFGDLERLALRLLADDAGGPTAVAHQVRAEFDHVLVDEFQDDSELQATVLRALARPGGAGGREGNLFVVGDVKQSIYGFRQADPEQFLDLFRRTLPVRTLSPQVVGRRINLAHNFRTAPALLVEINALFERLFSERVGGLAYDENHRLEAGRPNAPALGPRVQWYLLDRDDDGPRGAEDDGDTDAEAADDAPPDLSTTDPEAAHVARAIRRLHDVDGHAWRDIAVLVRSSKSTVPLLTRAFNEMGVPFFTSEVRAFLQQPEVVDLTTILRAIHDPFDEVRLVGFLRGPAGEWTADQLLALRMVDRGGRLFDNLKTAAARDDHELHAAATAALHRLRGWQHAARHETMAALVLRVVRELHLREAVAALPSPDQRLLWLESLRERAEQFDGFQRRGLASFLAFLDDIEHRDEEIAVPPALATDADAVRVMTVHKSKGLEFPVVILPWLGTKFNERDLGNPVLFDRREGTALNVAIDPDADAKAPTAATFLKPLLREKMRGEELRLFYVAATRARERLLLMGSRRQAAARLDEARTAPPIAGADGARAVASATTPLDWLFLALAGRPELSAPVAGSALAVLLAPLAGAAADPGDAAESTDRAQALAAWQREAPAWADLLRAIARPPAPAHVLRGKVSVTEAKRAHDALHSPANPPRRRRWARRATADDAVPDWWPAALTLGASATNADPRRRGTLTHRLCALVDLEALARGESVAGEVERLVALGDFTAEEARLLLVDDVEFFFRDTPLGQRVIAARAEVRREVPFTMRLRAGDFNPAAADPDDIVLVQGIVDLLMTERPRGGPPRRTIIDFKTDARYGVSIEDLDALLAEYRPQLLLYREGMGRALGVAIDQAWLHFLRVRQPERVDPGPDPGEALGILNAAVVLPRETP